MNNNYNILITGCEGQVGKEFQKIGDSDFTFVSRETLDITDSDAVQAFLRNSNFTHIINCAAYTAVDKAETEKDLCFQVNAEAVKNLALACEKYNVVLVHISSDYVYHPNNDLPIDEASTCHPKGVYAESKLAGENHIRQIIKRHIILRTSWVYSSFGNNFVKTMLRLGKEKDSLNVVNDQIGSPTYAADIASVILEMIQNGEKWGTYNFSNLGFISWAEFAKEIFKQRKLEVIVNEIPTSDYPTPASRPLNSRLIKSKITDKFNVELSYWKTSLKKCLKELDN
ncbi:dTDP-4-dehydrorhamnose reductase [Portibacter lacus]|uniref:dTDP-4-dehydrorhamnose reductase n=1 Tax=Portibacter lacus TaxID=1099794 RepID=A0AA37SXD6_9BACT|nr:dTDP-4-dehydrorhamnose reductase [Portibacter lacus]GLR19460.1 NAD(P)-dependent oxidoreductase [Portibacter lacus]